jgi:SAM-dependent methyltransferase
MADEDVQARITTFWNVVAPGYDSPENVAVAGGVDYDRWSQAIAALLPISPARVLDVGTGTGFVAGILAELDHRVTAIDLAEDMLEIARARGTTSRRSGSASVTRSRPISRTPLHHADPVRAARNAAALTRAARAGRCRGRLSADHHHGARDAAWLGHLARLRPPVRARGASAVDAIDAPLSDRLTAAVAEFRVSP